MTGEMEHASELEIAHVLFMDIVGYSKLAIDEQSESRCRARRRDRFGDLLLSRNGTRCGAIRASIK